MKATLSHKTPLENASDGEPTNRANLSGREPEGPFARSVFDEDGDHAFNRTENRAVNHNRTYFLVTFATAFE